MDGLTKSILLWRDRRSTPSKMYDTMTVQFNITQTPGYGTYLDDAVDMPYGKTSDAVTKWQNFFGYKPCLFKNGQVVGYLNPNDYTKFEDGSPADITSGNAGDVMVEFPRRGIKISKSGNTVTVSMTKDPDNPEFTYYAHNRGNTKKDKFYLGAYLGASTSYWSKNDLRSLSNKTPITQTSLSDIRTYAGKLGTGYMEVGFYQFLFLQCMYLLQYKGNLDSQSVHGFGFCNNNGTGPASTGSTNTNGLMYGTTTGSSSSDHVKLFGIEDFWGNLQWYVDGYYVDENYHILTATDGFNNTGSGYMDHGAISWTSNVDAYMSDAICSSEVGFTPKSFMGRESSYFCDYASFGSQLVPYVGGHYNYYSDKYKAGIFHFEVNISPTYIPEGRVLGGRLAYL